MSATPELVEIGKALALLISTNSVELIFDKIRTIKAKGNKDETISSLESIIADLISDKNQLIQISQAFEEQLISQRMSSQEIEYITESIIPIIEKIVEGDGQGSENIQGKLDLLKPLLSKETINIMQILGFNFRKAIGEPLTEIVANLVMSVKSDSSSNEITLKLLEYNREIEYLKVCQDEAAYDRLRSTRE